MTEPFAQTEKKKDDKPATARVGRRWLRVVAFALALFYGITMGLVLFLQGWMIFPGRATQGKTFATSSRRPVVRWCG